MEPKPKPFLSEKQLLQEVPWLKRAAKEYRPVSGRSYTETNFLRGNLSIETLDRILPQISHKPNILLVGLGLDSEPLLCCYLPHRIAAHLQGRKINYSMTLVDVDGEVIEDVRNRTRLFLSHRQFEKKRSDKYQEYWEKYLEDTGQRGGETNQRLEEMKFCSYLEHEEGMLTYRDYLKYGVLFAEVSPQFNAKRANGEIRLIQDDIAIAELRRDALFDYVDLMNVLHLMPTLGQQLALANVTLSLRVGGHLLLNDIGGYVGEPVFSRLGGWLDDEKLRQLSLEVEDIISLKETSQTALLRKK